MNAPSPRATALSAAGAAVATLVPIALYQLHVTGSLPDPPGSCFDSERITMSKTAHPLGVPDSLLGLGSYGATWTLLLVSGRAPWARKLLIGKLVLDGGMAGFNVVRQVVSFRKLCSWCTGTALATAVLVPAGLRYARQPCDENG
jgi:uncharacterized membrane protein